MTYIIKIINKNIEKEEEKGKNLRKYFNNIYDKTNNPYMDIFKGCLNEIKNKDSDYKGSRDVSRMREVIINRKNDTKESEN